MQGTNKNSEYKFSNSDLQSSIKSKGKYVTQIIQMIGAMVGQISMKEMVWQT